MTPNHEPTRSDAAVSSSEAEQSAEDAKASPHPHADSNASSEPPSLPGLLLRGGFGGALMGLANLVPGISGGTMLLAAGIYPRFMSALSEITRLHFQRRSMMLLAVVGIAAATAILAASTSVMQLVLAHRWIMYSLFIGLTLGGVPVLWRLIDRRTAPMWIGVAAGFLGMAVLGIVQSAGGSAGGAGQGGFIWMLLAGAAAASAMILPGVSGGYLLLILGVYVPLLAAVDRFKGAAAALDWAALGTVGGQVILPVGLGVALGIGGVSNLLRWLLDRWARPTLGVLLGLLLGAVIGLFPFQRTAPPEPGEMLQGRRVVRAEQGDEAQQRGLVFAQSGRPVKPEQYPIHFFTPDPSQISGALGLILAGFAATWLIDRLGRPRGQSASSSANAQHAE